MNLPQINHLTIKNLIALEALKNNNSCSDLELDGIEPLKFVSESLKHSLEFGGITEANKFASIYGFDNNFFYVIESVDTDTKSIIYYERGIAYIYSNDDRTFLKRIRLFVSGKNSNEFSVSQDGVPQPINCSSFKTLIYSSVPPTYLECLASEHSVLCSSTSSLPNPVTMENNSILARLDQDIQSLSFDSDHFVNFVVNAISKFAKQLKLKTSKLSLKRVESEILDMIPSSNIKAKKGSLYYDETDNTLKLYNGDSWKTLAFVKD